MNLDNGTLALIAVGSSVSANCQSCLERNVGMALRCGADVQQISEAIEVGKRVRQGAANKMDKFALTVNGSAFATANEAGSGCACG